MQKHGHWTVIDTSKAKRINGYKYSCLCVCGKKGLIQKKYLLNGKTKSCGCRGVYNGIKIGGFLLKKILGLKNRRYAIYICQHKKQFKSRISKNGLPRLKTCPCLRTYVTSLKHGESSWKIRTPEYKCWRGIKQRCLNKNSASYNSYGGRGIKICNRWLDYRNFIKDMGRKQKGFSIDRINNSGNYEPSNCRWANSSQQSSNRDCILKARASKFCKRGHLWNTKNIIYNNLGSRQCKLCIKFLREARQLKKQQGIQ